jgi:hypothetical protein
MAELTFSESVENLSGSLVERVDGILQVRLMAFLHPSDVDLQPSGNHNLGPLTRIYSPRLYLLFQVEFSSFLA